ncbi:MAG: CHAT domain-containing tetratricopeptide repeat protein [Planctomycetota bacterium]
MRALVAFAAAICLSTSAPTPPTVLGACAASHTDLESLRERVADGQYERAVSEVALVLECGTDACASDLPDILALGVEALRRSGYRGDPVTLTLAHAAIELAEELFGCGDLRCVPALVQLGATQSVRQQWVAACHTLRRAVAIAERAHGVDDPRLALPLAYLGAAVASSGEPVEAGLALVDRALALRGSAAHPTERAFALEMRAQLRRSAGAPVEELLRYYEDAVALRRAGHGADHPLTCNALGALAGMQLDRADFAAAQSTLEEVLAILEDGGGLPSTARKAWNDLGGAYEATGHFRDAQRCYDNALLALERAGETDRAWHAAVIESSARLAFRRGDLARAGELAQRALALTRASEGTDGERLSHVLLLCGWIELETAADLERVRNYLRESDASRRGANAERVRADALVLSAHVAARVGDLAAAHADLERAIVMQRALGGEAHADLSQSVRTLSRIVRLQGDPARACALALEAEAIALAQWNDAAARMSELAAIGLGESAEFAGTLDAALLYASEKNDPLLVARVWTAVVRRRDRAFAEIRARAELARAAQQDVPQVAHAAARLADARDELARVHARRSSSRAGADAHAEFEHARSRRAAAERDFAAVCADRLSGAWRDATFDDVRSALPEHTALVAYFAGSAPCALQVAAARPLAWQPVWYAFVLPSRDAAPRLVALGSRGPIARHANMLDRMGTHRVEDLPLWRAESSDLRALVWDPAAVHLDSTRSVFLVLEQELARVPFHALATGESTFLVDGPYSTHVLDSERTLLEPPVKPGRGMLALADPERESASGAGITMRGNSALPRLPEARPESHAIRAIWRRSPHGDEPVDLLFGAKASERALQRLAADRRVVHIAAHGYSAQSRDTRTLGVVRGAPERAPAPSVDSAAHGMSEFFLGAGLVLASEDPNLAGDGVLTAEEVQSLALDGVEWVVLSACDTARGEARSGETVLGLRRAFRTAGARTVIASLWPVEDKDARAFMTALYLRRLERGESTSAALAGAQLDVLRRLRAAGGSTHPLRWACFVATGDWR